MADFSVSAQSLYFEQVWFCSQSAPSFIPLTLSNLRTDGAEVTVKTSVKVHSGSEFPAMFKFVDLAELGVVRAEDVDIASLETLLLDLGQQDILLKGFESKVVLGVLMPQYPRGPGNHDRTSLFNVSARVVLQSDSAPEGQALASLDLSVSATFCTPVLYVDETDIDFEQCSAGETYVRDIQVWNRSECALLYRIVPFLSASSSGGGGGGAGTESTTTSLVFQDS